MNRRTRRLKHRLADRAAGKPAGPDRQTAFATALAHYRAGRLREAAATLRRLLDVRPEDTEVLCNLGAVLRAQGRLDEAVALYRRALAIAPEYAEAHNNLGNALRHQGRLEDAVACYRRALEIAPDYAGGHANLGDVLMAQGQTEEAVSSYRRALELDPKSASAHNSLGNALRAQGRQDEAIASYRRALEISPDNADAHNNLGLALKAQGQTEQALASYRRALAVEPDKPQVLNNLGVLLKALGDVDGAIASYARALAVAPRYAEAHYNLGAAYQAKGLFDEASAAYEEALRLNPRFAAAYGNLAVARRIRDGDPLIARIEALLGEPGLSDDDRSLLNFALGKCFDDLGRFDEAFHHYRLGNELLGGARLHDSELSDALFETLAATFTPALFERKRGLGSESEQPVFIVGMPRSGTTLIEQILASHPQVHGAGELEDINRMARDLPGTMGTDLAYPACVALLDGPIARRLAAGYLEHLEALSAGAPRVTDKMPLNFLHLGLIALLFPRARVIHCRRDPLDVCLSCYFQDFNNLRGGLSFACDLDHLGRYYRRYERLMAHWRETLGLPILEVDYERVVADKETEARRIVAFCGLEWDDACLAFHRTGRAIKTASAWQARQPIYATSVERWRRYDAHLAPLKAALEAEGTASTAPSGAAR